MKSIFSSHGDASASSHTPRMRLCLCLAILLLTAVSIGQANAACETRDVASLLEQSHLARIAGDLNKAYLYVGRALRLDPTNLHARYTKALIMIDEGKTNPPQFKSGLAMLTRAASELVPYKSLPPEDRRCPETEKLYSIFNTIGVEYYKSGDMKNAEIYYLKGERDTDGLDNQSRAKLYNNLALLYQNQLNLDKAAAYYEKAKNAKNPEATTRLKAIRQIQGDAPKN